MATKPQRTTGDDCILPPEICIEILTRLPAKSVLRFRSVCKSWYSLFSCPTFISDYSTGNLNKNDNRVLLKLADSKGFVRACSFSSHDESFMESRELDDLPQKFLGPKVEIVGSCNGLVCFSKYERVEVINFLIWNPTISKVVELPSRRYCPSFLQPFYFGFGFDSKTGDYKVMFRHLGDSDCSDADGNYSDRFHAGGNVCEIFDLSKGVWRSISPRVHSWPNIGRDLRKVTGRPECYLNGAVHWTGFRRYGHPDSILLSFDMSDEVFREIRMPDFAEFDDDDDDDDDDDYDDDRVETRSVIFGGLIHVIVWKRKKNDKVIDMNEDCSVWVMREYGVAESWAKLFNIDLPSAEIYQGIEPDKFLSWENGGILMVHDLWEDEDKDVEYGDRQELLLYNTESGKCKQLCSFSKCIRDMCLYEESLVLM